MVQSWVYLGTSHEGLKILKETPISDIDVKHSHMKHHQAWTHFRFGSSRNEPTSEAGQTTQPIAPGMHQMRLSLTHIRVLYNQHDIRTMHILGLPQAQKGFPYSQQKKSCRTQNAIKPANKKNWPQQIQVYTPRKLCSNAAAGISLTNAQPEVSGQYPCFWHSKKGRGLG